MTRTWLHAPAPHAKKVGLRYTSEAFLPSGSSAKHTDGEHDVLLMLEKAARLSVTVGSTDALKLVSTLEQVQSLKFFHRDLKPDKIVIPVNVEPVIIDFDNSECSEYIQTWDADSPPADVPVTAASPSIWWSVEQGNDPAFIVPPSAQFITPSVRQQIVAQLAGQWYTPCNLYEQAVHLHSAPPAPAAIAIGSLDTVYYFAVSGAFVADAHQAFIRYIDAIITALSLILVQVLAALARLSVVINFILAIIAAFLHYGHRHEPGDDDSLLARRNWTSLGSVPAIS